MKFTKILSGMLAATLISSSFTGFSVSVNAAATLQTLPYTNTFSSGSDFSVSNGITHVNNDTSGSFAVTDGKLTLSGASGIPSGSAKHAVEVSFNEVNSGILVLEYDLKLTTIDRGSYANCNVGEDLLKITAEDGTLVTKVYGNGGGTNSGALWGRKSNGTFGALPANNQAWYVGTYRVKVELDLDNGTYKLWQNNINQTSGEETEFQVHASEVRSQAPFYDSFALESTTVGKVRMAVPCNGDSIDNIRVYKKFDIAAETNPTLDILSGETKALGIDFTVGSYADADLTFTVTDNDDGNGNPIISFNERTGNVTGLAEGTCKIKAKSEIAAWEQEYTINVRLLATEIKAVKKGTDEESGTLYFGIEGKETMTLEAKGVTPANSLPGEVAWKGSALTTAQYVTIGRTTGELTAKKVGNVTIIADPQSPSTAANAEFNLEIKVPEGKIVEEGQTSAIGEFSLYLASAENPAGTKKLELFFAEGEPNGAIAWSVVDGNGNPSNVVTIDNASSYTPTFTANNQGTATIKAVYLTGVNARTYQCTVKVKKSVDSITVSTVNPSADSSLEIGETLPLTVSVYPTDADDVSAADWIWKSSNNYVATVSSTGVVTAVGRGVATIYVHCGGKETSYSVVVDGGQVSSEQSKTTQLISFAAVKGSFTDIGDMVWAQSAVQLAAANGVMTPDTENFFGAKRNIKRDEFVSVILRTLSLTSEVADEPIVKTFDDVTEENPYYAEIMKAVELGIIEGVSDTSFAPQDDITRQDMAVVVMKALEVAGIDTAEGKLDFADKDLIAGYAKKSVRVLSKMYIMVGKDDGNFDPLANTTRAEAAVISEKITAIR